MTEAKYIWMDGKFVDWFDAKTMMEDVQYLNCKNILNDC